MKNILVTGGRGFIGFNALQLWKNQYPDCNFIEIDNQTYADLFMVEKKNKWLDSHEIPRFVVDLGSDEAIESLISIIETFNIDSIIHFAAESHVDNSLAGPEKFYQSNIMGTIHVLEAVRKTKIRLLQVSTDEVYGISYPNTGLTPDSVLKPSSPYSSSKASADMITLAYVKSFGINATITRCCNNFGPWQHTEKLIPTILTRLENNQKIPVYGDGQQCRQWIYVDDHNRAIMDIFTNMQPGKVYHISSNLSGYMKNLSIIDFFGEIYGKPINEIVDFVKDRPAHDTSYYLTHYENLEYGENHIKDMLSQTCNWYREYGENFK